MIALLLVRQRAVKNYVDLSEKKKRNQGRCCDWCISIHFLFAFFPFRYRRCGSVKVKLVLNFSKELYTIQNCKVFIQYLYRKIAAT